VESIKLTSETYSVFYEHVRRPVWRL